MLGAEEPSQLSCVGHPLCSSLSLSAPLSLSSFTAGPGPIESQVSCRDKQVYCPMEALLPFIACRREAYVKRISNEATPTCQELT